MRFIHTSDWQLGKPFGRLPERGARGAAGGAARCDRQPRRRRPARGRARRPGGGRRVRQFRARRSCLSPGADAHEGRRGRALGAAARQPRPGPRRRAVEPACRRVAGQCRDLRRAAAGRADGRRLAAARAAPVQAHAGGSHGVVRPRRDAARRVAGRSGARLDHRLRRPRSLPTNLLPPDRAKRSGLAYLALGDWHGRLAVDPVHALQRHA